jgi:hypothetical protein
LFFINLKFKVHRGAFMLTPKNPGEADNENRMKLKKKGTEEAEPETGKLGKGGKPVVEKKVLKTRPNVPKEFKTAEPFKPKKPGGGSGELIWNAETGRYE